MRHCIFCGPTEAPITREHVWSDWISGVLGPRLAEIATTKPETRATQFRRGELHVDRQYPSDNLQEKVRVICEHCNNVTLSRLENMAKPILSPMILGKSGYVSIPDQVVIAAWITKMAMVWEYTDNYEPKYFTQAERENFRSTFRPATDNTWIWLAAVESRYPARMSQNVLWSQPGVGEPARFHITTGVIGGLGFQLLTRRHHDSKTASDYRAIMNKWRASTALIYPHIFPIRWPPREILTGEMVVDFEERFGGVPLKRQP